MKQSGFGYWLIGIFSFKFCIQQIFPFRISNVVQDFKFRSLKASFRFFLHFFCGKRVLLFLVEWI